MADPRVEKFAKVLVEYCTRIKPGDRCLIEATTAAEPLVRALYLEILKAGGQPVPLLQLPDMFFPQHEDLLTMYGNDAQLDFVPPLQKLAYDQFESRVRIHSTTNTRSQTAMDASRPRSATTRRALSPRRRSAAARMERFKWVTTLYPTEAYAQDAELSFEQYEDFVFRACHVNEEDPVKFWRKVEQDHERSIKWMEKKNQVVLRGPNVDMTLSVKGRKFMNSCGTHNMPDGEIYTGPIEELANGWVRFTYPAIYGGVAVEGAELTFSNGRVTQASAVKNQDYLLKMLETDAGARYLGEFAIGTNFEINKFTGTDPVR